MRVLRGALYFHALAWLVIGVLFGLFPTVLFSWFDQPEYVEGAWVRLFGVQSVGLAMFMVLVGHRAEELWWWSWGFVLSTAAVAAVFTLNAAFGVPLMGSTVIWWVLAGLSWGLASAVLVGLNMAARERPPAEHEPAPARDPHPRGR